jgi:hypothetical protein
MRVQQLRRVRTGDWCTRAGSAEPLDASLVLVFGGAERLSGSAWYAELRERYPQAHIVSATTAGEISDVEVTDDSIVATAVELRHARVRVAAVDLSEQAESATRGIELARALGAEDLRHLFVLSDGLLVNGSELVRGLREALPAGVAATGGLAGDGARMQRTLVGVDELPRQGRIVGIGFYGASLDCSCGSRGGWDPFGPDRLVTRAEHNVVFELDGRPSLQLYREYLGDHSAGLPSTGLLFPLAVVLPSGDSLVRTLLAVDDAAGSITFAGDIPQGSIVKLMRANFDRLVDGAQGAARSASLAEPASLSLLVSCVGRKLLLGPRVEEEVEAVRESLGPEAVLAGFYSYGEICPVRAFSGCELHNQTMTVTTLREIDP